tara:strand:+ start:940 stop:1095 length:156 start_codon:yes stop_codon:yes gene_type:complete
MTKAQRIAMLDTIGIFVTGYSGHTQTFFAVNEDGDEFVFTTDEAGNFRCQG